MATKPNKLTSVLNQASAAKSVKEYFDRIDPDKGGDGLVWAKCIDKQNRYVNLNIFGLDGQRKKVPPVFPGDPVNLNDESTFEELKRAGDLHKAVVKGLLRLMTTEEAIEHFDKKSKTLNRTVEDLAKDAHQRARASLSHQGVTDPDHSKRIRHDIDDAGLDEDEINPRVQYLMSQVNYKLEDYERMPASELLNELMNMEDTLTYLDLEIIRSQGFWGSVKQWALKKQGELASQDDPALDEQDDVLNARGELY